MAEDAERDENEKKEGTAAPPRHTRRWRRIVWRLVLALVALVVVAYAGLRIWQWVVVPKGAPLIGLSLDTAWHSRLGFSDKTYEIAITRVGGRMVRIRPGDESAEEVLDRIDALFLTGGGDIDPRIYGGRPGSAKLVDRERDDFEIELIRGALERDMPILGICRGIQILNVAHGGAIRNLRDDPKLHDTHGIELDSWRAHTVTITTGSRVGRIVGAGVKQVNSFHAQAVGRVGRGLQVAARAPDGVVEALERNDRRFVLATQWHPEILSLNNKTDLALFEEFLKEAKAYRARRQRR